MFWCFCCTWAEPLSLSTIHALLIKPLSSDFYECFLHLVKSKVLATAHFATGMSFVRARGFNCGKTESTKQPTLLQTRNQTLRGNRRGRGSETFFKTKCDDYTILSFFGHIQIGKEHLTKSFMQRKLNILLPRGCIPFLVPRLV